MQEELLDGRLIIKSGDITDEVVDAVVNAANSTLLGGSGVDGAIHRRGGPGILEECRKVRATRFPHGLPTGEAVMTTGGDLPARYVIHTVGPVYGMNQGRDAELLAACYRNSIELAMSNDLRTLAFPSISTGVYGYPKREAAPVVFRTVQELIKVSAQIEIRLVFFSETDAHTFLERCR
ncbi:MAG TPA: O-acetyl-ADP-ribose deacetylase [Pyrinomonadaceae bacterium]|nr:O-acetyl-ADP-ribose deacetylase [Pyrinomonadaceae bacterium]